MACERGAEPLVRRVTPIERRTREIYAGVVLYF